MTDRENLMQRLNVQGFAISDILLYLDTHPCDQQAMDYYHRYCSMYEETKAEYEKCYGPINVTGVTDTDRWTWVSTPWPWEGSAC